MINIVNKDNCCGCGACEQICPKQCISMIEDNEGFLYPKVELSICIDCGLCERVCPVINQGDEKKPLHVYAAMNKNEDIRLRSSSGGIFTLLAERIIEKDGVVFGAIFNDKWDVVHSYTETIDGLEQLRKSKYVQSSIGESYKNCKKILDANREVLFVGAPCQIKGLKLFLRKEYDNLLAVDFLCHGVPSPKVWRMYLDEVVRTKCRIGKSTVSLSLNDISDISFRDKELGWKKYGFKIWSHYGSKVAQNTSLYTDNTQDNIEDVVFCELLHENIYMRGFLNDLYLRPSCYRCPSKQGRSSSDITIADYWNIGAVAPEVDDDKGTGLVLINTKKGKEAYPIKLTNYIETGYEESQGHNGGFKTYLPDHPYRTLFFDGLDCCSDISTHIITSLYVPKNSFIRRAKRKIQSIINKIIRR